MQIESVENNLQPGEGKTISLPSICGNLLSPPNSSSYTCDNTMSFGYSVSDFITLITLVNTVRRQFVDAPDQFRAISGE